MGVLSSRMRKTLFQSRMVIPAEAGIQFFQGVLGSRSLLKTCRDKLRGSDGPVEFFRNLLGFKDNSFCRLAFEFR
jgi:hypothetical protein